MTHKLQINSELSTIRVYPTGRREWVKRGVVEKASWADGTVEYYVSGKLRKIEYTDRTVTHHTNNEIHRSGKPALLYPDGSRFWVTEGKFHREGDRPAAVYPDGNKFWMVEGKFHRENDKPACVFPSQNIYEYFVDGRRHRRNGPAVETPLFSEYWIDGNVIPEFLYWKLINHTVAPHHFLTERNVEVRTLILGALGGYIGFFHKLSESAVDVTVVEKNGVEKLIKISSDDDRNGPMTLVIVKDGTSDNIYALRVPPGVKSINEAKAYTFGKTTQEYNPSVET
jgi:hypothetical protein